MRTSSRSVHPILRLALVAGLALLAITPAAAAAPVRVDVPRFARTMPMRLGVRLGRAVRVVHVSVDRRDVTRRLTRRGRLRRATIPRRMLRAGANHVVVRVRARGRSRTVVRRFYVAGRRTRGLLAVAAPRRATGALRVRARTATEPFGFAVWVNGRRASSALAGRIVRAGTLSAGDGLRFGRNRVEIVAWQRDGRWDVERRTVTVPRSHPLADAGRPLRPRVGSRVRLDGRSSRPSQAGAVLSFRWRLVGRASRTRARLLHARSARPVLLARRRGRVRVALRVVERRRGGGVGRSSDQLAVAVAAAVPPMGMRLQVGGTNPPSITLGDQRLQFGTFVDPDNPGRRDIPTSVHIVLIDRETLEVVDKQFLTPGSTVADYQLAYQRVAQSAEAKQHHLLWVAFGPPGCCAPGNRLPNNGFSELLYVGTTAPDGGPVGYRNWGATTRAFEPVGPNPGAVRVWLQRDSRGLFSVAPTDKVTFDSSSESTANGNAIRLVGRYGAQGAIYSSASLRPGWSGFELMAFERGALNPLRGYPRTYAVNTDDGRDQYEQQRLADELEAALNAGAFVILQSIGAPKPTTPAWANIAAQLERIGASGHVFNTLDGSVDPVHPAEPDSRHGGSYAVAGCVACGEPAESSYPLQRTPGSGSVTGLLTVDDDFRYRVQLEQTGVVGDAELSYGLAQLATADPGRWPVGDTPAEQAAMDYIFHAPPMRLDQLSRASWCPGVAGLRAVYCANRSWDASQIPAYPGDAAFCKPGFGDCRAAYDRVVAQLKLEWSDLNQVKALFDDIRDVLTFSKASAGQSPQEISDSIVGAINRQAAGEADSTLAEALNFGLETATELLSLAEMEPAAAGFGLVAAALSAGAELGHGPNDERLEDLRARGDELAIELDNQYLENLAARARVHQLVVTDWHKLDTVAHRWSLNDELDHELAVAVRVGIIRWLWQQIVPSAYGALLFNPPPAGLRVNDLRCFQRPHHSPDLLSKYLEDADDAGSWTPIDHFDVRGDGSLDPRYSVWLMMASGTFPQNLSFPPGSVLRQMFARGQGDPDTLHPQLLRPWFFRRADWVQTQDFRPEGSAPNNCMY